jgi:hypothetical protein
MNYKDYFKGKNEESTAISERISDAEKLLGIEDEKEEHGMSDKEAEKTSLDHLKKHPNYYSKLNKAGLDEEIPKFEDGAIKAPRVKGMVALGKIINVGKPFGKGANGNLSGYTNVSNEGDKETITAAGDVDSSIAQKSVGGEIAPGEGQRQGGPNSKGCIAGTKILGGENNNEQQMFENNKKNKITLDDLIKEAMAEMGLVPNPLQSYKVMPPTSARTSNDDWARKVQNEPEMTENSDDYDDDVVEPHPLTVNTVKCKRCGCKYDCRKGKDEMCPDCQQNISKKENITSPFNYGGEPNQLYEKAPPNFPSSLEARIKKQYGADNPTSYKVMWNLYNKGQVKEVMSRLEEKGGEHKWIQKAVNPSHKGYCTPMTKSTCTPHRKALAKRFKSGEIEEAGGMAVQDKSFRTVQDNPQLPKNRHKSDIDENKKKA